MGRRVTCPNCLTEQAAATYARCGCWHCRARDEQAQDDAAFAEFMDQDEAARWRELWDAVQRLDRGHLVKR